MQRGKEVWTEGRTESVDEGREKSKITDERGKGKSELQKHEVGNDLNADGVRGAQRLAAKATGLVAGARLHATCRKPGGSSFDTAPPQENGALAQERNTIQGFHEAIARLGARRAKILKQPGLFITHDCQYSHCSPSGWT